MKTHLSFFLLLIFGITSNLAGQSKNQDCQDGKVLCNKNSIFIDHLFGAGASTNEVSIPTNANSVFPESNVLWLKWGIASPGTLTFTLNPLNAQDDLDFILYKMPNGIESCEGKQAIRTMLTGRVLGEEVSGDDVCSGATGISDAGQGTLRNAGCKAYADNFLSAVETEAGESYALFINNFRSSGGLTIDFGGTAIFKEPMGDCPPTTVLQASEATTQTPVVHISEAYPNPGINQVQIAVQSETQSEGVLVLTDAQGRFKETRSVSFSPGANQLIFNISAFERGVYFIKIRLQNQTTLSRFVKG